MELTKQLIATLVVALRNYQRMQVSHSLPPFVEDLALALGLQKESEVETLIKMLYGAFSGQSEHEKSVHADTPGVLLVPVSIMHLHYSLVCSHNLTHIFYACNAQGIAQLTRRGVADIFQRICRELKMRKFNHDLLQETFARHRSLQLEELLRPEMIPAHPIFY